MKFVDSKSLKDYIDELTSSSDGEESGTEGEIPADSSVPVICECGCEQCEEADAFLGDLLLHIHPHYTECPLINGDDDLSIDGVSGGTSDSLGYILGDGEQMRLVINFLLYRKIVTLDALKKLINDIWKMSKMQQFYLMPILIHLCRVVISYIQHSADIFDANL
jgi:hypothetical protein